MNTFAAVSRAARRTSGLFVASLLALSLLSSGARAQIGSANYSSVVVDAATGNILSAANLDEPRFPASLTKMMTLYMLFEALRDRRISLNQYVPVSPNAASMSPTKLGLVPGSLITVEQAILGLVTRSANDAAAALGEMLGGDEERFAQMMTLRARSLGMTRTTFQNASGLPDWAQVTTARDMATLGRRLIQDFPNYYHYFSTPSFVYAGRVIFNHQRLLQSYPGADGLKTGYIDASGYNVVTSALRGDVRLVGVVLGGASGAERDRHMTVLLDQGFERMGVSPLLARRDPGRFPSVISSARAAPLVSPYAAPLAAPYAAREVTTPRPATQRFRPGRQATPRASDTRLLGRRGQDAQAAPPLMRVGRPVVQPARPMSRTPVGRPAVRG